MDALGWVLANCRFAAFNAPQRGDRIELPTMPGQYYLVTDKPQLGQDPRGQSFWHARVKDQQGREQMLSSDRVPSWSHYKGKNYGWHDEQITQDRFKKQEQEQGGLIKAFEEQYKFPDGTPLKRGRQMDLLVKPGAPGQLGAFHGALVRIVDIDYANQTVRLEPKDPEHQDLAEYLAAVPAAEVAQFAAPVMNQAIAREPVTLPNGQRIDAEQLMQMTPGLNQLARAGQVTLRAQVYVNYESGKGTGEELFTRDMMNRNIGQDQVEALTKFTRNNTPVKINPVDGSRSPRGPWTGTVYIAAPIPDEVKREIAAVAPESQYRQNERDGTMVIVSVPLYKQMVSFGVLDR